MEKISSELDYTPKVLNHSSVVYRKLTPQGAATAIPLSASSAVGPTEIVISPACFNPSKSRLNFQVQLGDPGASVKANWVNANALTKISRLVLYDSASSQIWCDVSNFEKYASLMVPLATSFDEFSTKGGNATLGAAGGNGNPQILPTTSALSTPYPKEDIEKCNSLINVTDGNVAMASTLGYNSYQGRRQLYVGADTTASFIDYSIPFSAFKFTALGLDKVIYSPSNLIMQIYWNATDNFGWFSESITSPIATSINSLAANSVFVNNVSVSLATEGNLSIVSSVIDRVMKTGVSIPIAYPTVTRTQLAAATSHSTQLQLTRGYGNRILAIVTAPFTNTTTPADAPTVNHRNSHTRGLLTNYNTFLNNTAILYPNNIDCTQGEDWKIANREYYKKSVVQNAGEYVNAEYALIDSFVGTRPMHEVDQTEIDGLDVSTQSATWSIVANYSANTAATYVSIIIGQKTLTLSNMGSMVQ